MLTLPCKTAIVEIRGKLGSWVYARNPQGPLRRPWRLSTVPNSPAQNSWQTNFKNAALRWNSTLTETQRQAWRQLATQRVRMDSLKQSYTMSGQNLHAACNAVTHGYSGNYLDDAPAHLHVHQPTGLSIITASSFVQILHIALDGTLDADELWILASTPQCKPGFNSPQRLWRTITIGSTPLPTTYSAISDYTTAFGPLILGKKLYAKLSIANMSTGAVSQALSAQAFVT